MTQNLFGQSILWDKEEVLVTHCKLSGTEYMMAYTPNIDKTEFTEILNIIKMK